jgi:thiamine biosynthesis lipoprotein
VVSIDSGGLATSSTTVRRWRTDVGDAHHLLDPSTGRPAISCWRTVSVAATTCLEANVAATAAIVLSGSATRWLADRQLPARLVGVDGEVELVAGWPADEEAA